LSPEASQAVQSSDNEEVEKSRWNLAVGFRGESFLEFGSTYFGSVGRNVLLFAGEGFDPRTARFAERLGSWKPEGLSAILIREERPGPDPALANLANENAARLRATVPSFVEKLIPVFDPSDNAVVGGRDAAMVAADSHLDDYTDIVVDLSAMSIGIAFPLVAKLLESSVACGCNLHAVVTSDAALDASIIPQPAEEATAVHGFLGGLGLSENADAAKLWLPQLAEGRGELLDRIFRKVAPHDTCPILPFPADNPRSGDVILEEYLELIDDAWEVDVRNMIYAAEDNPLDVYRTILDLDDARQPVFENDGGSICVLSPVGSKVLALGALMAALERRYAVYHVEAVGYAASASELAAYPSDRGRFAHVWLAGDPYRIQ
jgi:hypothetical protein